MKSGLLASTIVRKELLSAALAQRKDVARVEIKQIDSRLTARLIRTEGHPPRIIAEGCASGDSPGAGVRRWNKRNGWRIGHTAANGMSALCRGWRKPPDVGGNH
jgi:hypothetical protein